jgi:hypothetical protein
LIVSLRCLHLLSVPAGHPNQRRSQAPPSPLVLHASGAVWDGGMAGDGTPRVVRADTPFVRWFYYSGGRTLLLLCYSA